MSKAFVNVRNDVIKVSSMFIVTAVLSGKSLSDKAWQTELMNTLIGYVLLMTLMFSLAAGLYYGLKTIRLI